MKLNINSLAMFCLIAALIIPSLTNAQPVFDDDVNDIPVDGGLSLLVAAGVGYGVKKFKEQKYGRKL